jgi:DNA-binding NtrC family response regulator
MAKNSAPPRVLVVDDEALIRWSLRKALTTLGCDVLEAGDAQSALRLTSDHGNFDAVVLDLKLPDSQDLGLLGRLRERLPEARLVLMTAFGTPETEADAMTLGAYRVVRKPFDVKALAALVADSASKGPRESH